jgi:hypothetical protein
MYVFDNNSLRILCESYYPDRFPSLWEKFNTLISEGSATSVREILREIERWSPGRRLVRWAKDHKEFFPAPTPEELDFVGRIFAVRHFQGLLRKKAILEGLPVADPFIIARAKISGGIVVTQEQFKENAPQIPNVCQHFGVPYLDLEGFMEGEGWQF